MKHQILLVLVASAVLSGCGESTSLKRITTLEEQVAALQLEMLELQAAQGDPAIDASANPEIKTLREWALELQNKTRAEVVDVMGPPDYAIRDGYALRYRERVFDPVIRTTSGLTLWFDKTSERLTHLGTGFTSRSVDEVLSEK